MRRPLPAAAPPQGNVITESQGILAKYWLNPLHPALGKNSSLFFFSGPRSEADGKTPRQSLSSPNGLSVFLRVKRLCGPLA
jgi:hypothetical protein